MRIFLVLCFYTLTRFLHKTDEVHQSLENVLSVVHVHTMELALGIFLQKLGITSAHTHIKVTMTP